MKCFMAFSLRVSAGYVQSVSEGYTGGERAILVTPQFTSVSESCLSFYLISTKDDTDDTDLDNCIAIYANELAYPVAGRQVWKTGMIRMFIHLFCIPGAGLCAPCNLLVKTLRHCTRDINITDGTTMNNVSVVLPPGTYRIMIEATAASVVASYIALTNVNVEPGRCPGTNNSCSENQFT